MTCILYSATWGLVRDIYLISATKPSVSMLWIITHCIQTDEQQMKWKINIKCVKKIHNEPPQQLFLIKQYIISPTHYTPHKLWTLNYSVAGFHVSALLSIKSITIHICGCSAFGSYHPCDNKCKSERMRWRHTDDFDLHVRDMPLYSFTYLLFFLFHWFYL